MKVGPPAAHTVHDCDAHAYKWRDAQETAPKINKILVGRCARARVVCCGRAAYQDQGTTDWTGPASPAVLSHSARTPMPPSFFRAPSPCDTLGFSVSRVVWRTHSSFGDRSRGAAGPPTWNSLPRDPRTLDISYKHFKTYTEDIYTAPCDIYIG